MSSDCHIKGLELICKLKIKLSEIIIFGRQRDHYIKLEWRLFSDVLD